MVVLDIERPKSCNSCPMCFKLGNASMCIVGHMPIPLDDSIDENCPIIPEEDSVIPKISTSPATWIEVEFERPLPFGGALTERGYRCSNCGFFRHKKKGKSKYCEDCGELMLNYSALPALTQNNASRI